VAVVIFLGSVLVKVCFIKHWTTLVIYNGRRDTGVQEPEFDVGILSSVAVFFKAFSCSEDDMGRLFRSSQLSFFR
jgi:hypothetical protein